MGWSIHCAARFIFYSVMFVSGPWELLIVLGLQFCLKAISYTVGFVSPNRAFLHSRKMAFSTQLFSTEFSDWGIQSKNSNFSTGSLSRKTLSKKFYTCFFNPSHRSFHKTHPHAHTPIPGTTQQYHTTAPTLPWLSLLLLLATSQHGALLAPLASSMYHTTAVARVIDAILPTTATPAVALAALG